MGDYMARHDSEYLEHEELINELERQLLQDVADMNLDQCDLDNAIDYVQDRVTLFRYLRDCCYLLAEARERLLETVRWRTALAFSQLTWQSVASEFFDNGFAFFHKQDVLGRPVAVIRMRHFPQFKDTTKPLSEYIPTYACLVMEMARQLTRDITQQRQSKACLDTPSLVSQIVVVINIAQAPMVPLEKQLVYDLREIMEKRFPGMIGTIHVMNFGWMYQGLWQMVKFMLSERARRRIGFPTAKQVMEHIPQENLLTELGGSDEFEWSFEKDRVLQTYGCGSVRQEPGPRERCASVSSVESSSDELFFDALDTPTQSPRYRSSRFSSVSTSVYHTPGTHTPQGLQTSHLGVPWTLMLPGVSRQHHWIGLHIRASFLTSFIDGRLHQQGVSALMLSERLNQVAQSEPELDKEDGDDMVVIVQTPIVISASMTQPTTRQPHLKTMLIRTEHRLVRLTRHLFRLSFAHKGVLYWILLYIFLRGPVEHTLRRTLARALGATPRNLVYTTVGLTATVAAALSSSLSSSLHRIAYGDALRPSNDT